MTYASNTISNDLITEEILQPFGRHSYQQTSLGIEKGWERFIHASLDTFLKYRCS